MFDNLFMKEWHQTLFLGLLLLAFVVFMVFACWFVHYKAERMNAEQAEEPECGKAEEPKKQQEENDFLEFWIPYQTTVISGAQQ